MSWKIALEAFPYLQQSLIVASLSLLVIFLVKLFDERTRFMKLQKNGLVRNHLTTLAYDLVRSHN